MMHRRFGPGCRPPWWPHGEPWPHAGAERHGYVTRRRFFRRVAVFGAVLLLCALFGVATLVWLAATKAGLVAGELRAVPLLLVMSSIGVFAAVAVMGGLFRRVGFPLAAVMEAADRVAGGDYDVRVAERGPRPMRALVRSFNTMTGRLQANDRLRRNLMADVAHELRTPLTVIQGKLEGLLDGVYPRDEPQLQ